MQCKKCRDANGRPLQMSSEHEQDYHGMTFYWKCRNCKKRVKSERVVFPHPEQVEAFRI